VADQPVGNVVGNARGEKSAARPPPSAPRNSGGCGKVRAKGFAAGTHGFAAEQSSSAVAVAAISSAPQ